MLTNLRQLLSTRNAGKTSSTPKYDDSLRSLVAHAATTAKTGSVTTRDLCIAIIEEPSPQVVTILDSANGSESLLERLLNLNIALPRLIETMLK